MHTVEVCGGVTGELARTPQGWCVNNDAEVRALSALGGDSHASGWLQAIAATLNHGLIHDFDMSSLSRSLGAICEYEYDFSSTRTMALYGLGPATVFAAAFSDDPRLEWWLGGTLLFRLGFNVANGYLWSDYLGNFNWHPGTICGWPEAYDSDYQDVIRSLSELPAPFWNRLKGHPQTWLRDLAAATDPATPSRELRRLAATGHTEVRLAAAVHPNIGSAALWRMVRDDDSPRLVAAAACNRRASRRLLRRLSHESWGAQCGVAGHPRTSARQLEHLASSALEGKEVGVACSVASNQRTPAWVLRWLADPWTAVKLDYEHAYVVAEAVAHNRCAPESLVQSLLAHPHRRVRAAAVCNPVVSADDAELLSGDRAKAVRGALAVRRDISDLVLALLAKDQQESVRRIVASNPRTHPDTLRELARDPVSQVRTELASNELAPADILASLANDSNMFVRSSVARNSATPADVLAGFASDTRHIQHWLAQNPATDTATLTHLAQHSDEWCRAALAENSSLPRTLLDQLASDPSIDVRRPALRSLKERFAA